MSASHPAPMPEHDVWRGGAQMTPLLTTSERDAVSRGNVSIYEAAIRNICRMLNGARVVVRSSLYPTVITLGNKLLSRKEKKIVTTVYCLLRKK